MTKQQSSLGAIRLRGHHILCILGFRGHGYNEAFVRNMGSIAERIFLPDNFVITLSASADSICAACPHCSTNGCQKSASAEETIQKRDLAVLKKLGLAPGMKILTKELWRTVFRALRLTDMRTLCRDCEWFKLHYCTEGLRRFKKMMGSVAAATEEGGPA